MYTFEEIWYLKHGVVYVRGRRIWFLFVDSTFKFDWCVIAES